MTPQAEKLVLDHLALVERLAKHVAKSLPAWVEMDELVAAGNMGLCEAASKYRPELGISFQHFAFKIIRGRIVDGYRGRNYPRLTQQIVEEWLNPGIGNRPPEAAAGQTAKGRNNIPPQLIDPSPNPEEQLLQEEADFLLILDVELAQRRLTAVERKAVAANVKGTSMREIGQRRNRSAAWAHYTIHGAREKLREELKDYDKAA